MIKKSKSEKAVNSTKPTTTKIAKVVEKAVKRVPKKSAEIKSKETPARKVDTSTLVGSVVSTPKGKNYKITGDGKVKKIHSLSDLRYLELDSLKNIGALNKALYGFLKDQDPETYQKKDGVYCRQFRMRYTDNEGFSIKDIKNFGVDCSDNFEDIPTPREIWEFISRPKLSYTGSVGAPKDKKPELINMVVQEATVLLRGKGDISDSRVKTVYNNIRNDKKVSDEVREFYMASLKTKFPILTPREETDINEQRKSATRKLARTKEFLVAIEKLKGLLPNRRFQVYYGKLKREFKGLSPRVQKIRSEQYVKKLIDLIKDETIFAEVKKPAPKFTGIEAYKVQELVNDSDTTVLIKQKNVTMQVNKSDLLVRYVLEKEPKLHVAIMKLYNTAITKEQFLKFPILKDRFEGFDYNLVKNTFNQLVYDTLCAYLNSKEQPTPIQIAYQNDVPTLKVKDRVAVEWLDYFGVFEGTVISTDNGIRIRYSADDVNFLFKHQVSTIKVIK